VRERHARRVVFDGVNQLLEEGLPTEQVRSLLYAVVVRCKELGATSLLTFETSSLFAADIRQRGCPPICDNWLLLRHARRRGELRSTLTVLKTRGSPHDPSTYGFRIAHGGIQLETRPLEPDDDARGAAVPQTLAPRSRSTSEL
jgi:circadian clock protein KaiC